MATKKDKASKPLQALEPSSSKGAKRGRRTRGDLEAAKRDNQIAKLYLKGYSQTHIAKAVGVVQSTVSKAIDAIKRKHSKLATKHVDQRLGRLIAESELVKHEAWKAFLKSTNNNTVPGDNAYLMTIGRQLIFEGRVTGLLKGEGILRTRGEDPIGEETPTEATTIEPTVTQNIQINNYQGFQTYTPEQMKLLEQLRATISD